MGWCLCCFGRKGGKAPGGSRSPAARIRPGAGNGSGSSGKAAACSRAVPAAGTRGIWLRFAGGDGVRRAPAQPFPHPPHGPTFPPPRSKTPLLSPGHRWFLQEGQETQPSSLSVGTSSGNTPGCDRPRLNPRVLREESGKRQLAALSCPNPQWIWHLGGSKASQGPPGDRPRKGSGSPALLLGSGRRQQRAQRPLKKQAEVIFFPARLRFTPGGGLLDDALGAILGWKTQKCDRDSKAQVPRRESRQKPEDPFILAPWFVPGDESGAGVGKGFTTQQAPDGQASPIPLAGHIQKRQRNGASWLLFPLCSRSGEHPEDPPPLPLSPARPLPASRWHWQSHCPPHPAARVFPKNALRGS